MTVAVVGCLVLLGLIRQSGISKKILEHEYIAVPLLRGGEFHNINSNDLKRATPGNGMERCSVLPTSTSDEMNWTVSWCIPSHHLHLLCGEVSTRVMFCENLVSKMTRDDNSESMFLFWVSIVEYAFLQDKE